VLRDFDKAGFSLVAGFKQGNRRYTFENRIEVIDLGLRLDDIEGLSDEDAFDRGSEEKRRANLRKNGARRDEVEFLLHRRVELNAMTSDQLVAFVERKSERRAALEVLTIESPRWNEFAEALERAVLKRDCQHDP
jgi:hypothetical protein